MTTTLRPAPPAHHTDPGPGDWYAVCANGRPIGRLHLATYGTWGPGTGWIDHVEILASRRRRGHACVALLAAEEILRGRGCGRVAVEVPEGNLAGLRLAATLGYVFDSRYLLARVRGGLGAARALPKPPPGLTLAPMSADEHAAYTARARARYTADLTATGWQPRHADGRTTARLGSEEPPARGPADTGMPAYALTDSGGGLLGTLWAAPSPGIPGRAEIRALDVAPEAQGRGHGRLLLRTAEHLAYRAGLGELGLELLGPAPGPRHLAAALGYRTQSRQLGKAIL
ncbi:GNAT family N-acetyltransferase [Yinghuangia aomiensis]|uniref:GNAT family N-acetyltransferase n=1 Tax=Yinghuangia aomiensis TaxID=676205 RepID=A0ABP9I9Z7_9ACTN